MSTRCIALFLVHSRFRAHPQSVRFLPTWRSAKFSRTRWARNATAPVLWLGLSSAVYRMTSQLNKTPASLTPFLFLSSDSVRG